MNPVEGLVNRFASLPGIGKKSAARIVFHLLSSPPQVCREWGEELRLLPDRIRHCKICGDYTETEVCAICSSPVREKSVLCVVERSQDLYAIEASGVFNGVYHVLQGVLSPIDGVGPEELGVGRLVERVKREGVQEVIVATNPTLEGDATAYYLNKLFSDEEVAVTRIASGLPVGGDVELADGISLARSLEERRKIH